MVLFFAISERSGLKKGERGEGQLGNFAVGNCSVFNFDLKNEQKRPQIDRNLTAVSPQLSRNYL